MLRPPPDQDARPWLGLRVKLTLWLVAIFLTIQAALAAALYLYQRRTLDNYFAGRIRARAEAIAQTISERNVVQSDADLLGLSNDLPSYALADPWIIALYDSKGTLEATTARPAPVLEATRREAVLRQGRSLSFREHFDALQPSTSEARAARAVLMAVADRDGDNHFLLVARLDSTFDSMMRVIGAAAILTVPAGAIAAAAAGWLITGLMIAPLQHLRRIAGSLAPEALDQDFIPAGRMTREQKILEDELQGTRSKLLYSLKAQERFISNVSHELLTPISVVLTEGQTLPLKTLDPHAQRYVQSVNDEMRRLGRMIKGFLSLTRHGEGKVIETPTPSDINEVVMEAVAECTMMAGQRDVQLVPTLDERDPPATVLGMGELLRVMVSNLLRNAIRFSPAGQRVLITVDREDASVKISIRDFGPGVPDELVKTLFDRFGKSPHEDTNARAFGLGLAIAQGIAELHTGRITVENMPDAGCAFAIILPTIQSAVEARS